MGIPEVVFVATRSIDKPSPLEKMFDSEVRQLHFGVKPVERVQDKWRLLGMETLRLTAHKTGDEYKDVELLHPVAIEAASRNDEEERAKTEAKKTQEKKKQAQQEALEAQVDVPANQAVTLPAQAANTLVFVAGAAAPPKDTSRPVLNGVLFKYSGGMDVEVVATDGFRLYRAFLHIIGSNVESWGSKENTLVVPAKELATWLKDNVLKVRPIASSLFTIDLVSVSRVSDGESVPGVQIIGPKGDKKVFAGIGGTFPHFTRLMPDRESVNWSVSASKSSWEEALDLVKGTANKGNGIVRIQAEPEKLTLSASEEVPGEAPLVVRKEVSADYQENAPGPDNGMIGVNARYLAEALRTFGDKDMVSLGAYTKSSAMRFDGGAIDDLIVMPMFVQW